MANDDEHPLIAFAATYGDPLFDYLNAFVAMTRVETLIEDVAKVSSLLETDCPEDSRWHPWFGAEAVSYYAVGYVTCLEWHAKSRLVDLLNFKPSAIRVTDVQKTVNDKLIVQMVSKQATVTQLVGAALKVSSLENYLSVVGRVFQELDIPCKVWDWLTGAASESTTCWIHPNRFAALARLFDFRHSLVHELGIGTMGHSNVRDAWTPDEARQTGNLVASLMCGVEAALTRYASRLFPNLLTEERWPVGSAQTFKEEYERLDAIADASVRAAEWNEERTASTWQSAREKFAGYLEAEETFIETAGMLHWRYFDARTPLRLRLFRYRIEFLTELLSHFESAEADTPDSADPTE